MRQPASPGDSLDSQTPPQPSNSLPSSSPPSPPPPPTHTHPPLHADEVAWLLNLRGGDIPYNPVFISYLSITPDSATLYVDAAKVQGEAGGKKGGM